MGMRINKFLARSGLASRRKSEEYIRQGRISVNGKRIEDLSVQVEDHDEVRVDGKLLHLPKERVIYMLNKPRGYMVSRSDPNFSHFVFDLLPEDESLLACGRLDVDSEGLLLFTNDGDLCQRLMHPSYEQEKEYLVTLSGRLTEEQREKLVGGLRVHGVFYRADSVKPGKDPHSYHVILHEGKKREIRRMFQSLSLPVMRLKRIRFGELPLENLKLGQYRRLTRQEEKILETGKRGSDCKIQKEKRTN